MVTNRLARPFCPVVFLKTKINIVYCYICTNKKMIETGSLEIRWIQGFINTNIEFVDETTVCYGCGNHICFLNLKTKVRSVFQSPGRGVGFLTANGRSGTFAFSEQKLSPSIFVCNFPELQLKNELKGTAQLDYTSLTFSDEGPYLGGCSSHPDYTITVWNWETAEAICMQSQAGRDVVYLTFNPLNWLQLCALGTTTLTVWNIEKSDSFHVLKPRVIELPETVVFAERCSDTALGISNKLPSIRRAHSKTLRSTRATLTPSAICWTATSQLYVGCAEGYLLLVDPEIFSVSVIFSPTTADSVPELQEFSFQAFTLSENSLIVAGKENALHCVQIRGTQTNITQTWHLEKPVTSVRLSPDNETLLLTAGLGQIYLLKPSKSDQILKILDVFSGNFLTAAFLQTDRNICVSLRDSGVLQLWSSDGTCLGSLHLHAKVTSLACCPIARYAAIGTESGRVLFIDLNEEEQPRLVHQIYLYHSAVDHLIFDQEGHYLLTGSSSDSHIYVMDAKPSARFSVIGYIAVSGHVLSLSTQCPSDGEKVKVLVLSTEQQDKNEDSSLLIMASLPAQNIAGLDCVDRHGCLSPHVLRLFNYKVPLPLTSCALGASEIFAYCQRNKSLQQFQLPEDTEGLTSQQVVQLKPIQEVKGHPLGPASVLLSPHCLWLASAGRDGLLRIRQTASIEQYVELWCHSCHLGGVRTVSFSSDGLSLLSTGFSDGSLVCSNLRIKSVNDENVDNALQHSHFRTQALKEEFDSENPILVNFRVWDEGSTKTEDSEVKVKASIDTTKQDEQIGVSLSAPSSDLTWLETKTEEVVKEDNKQHSEEKKRLRETVAEIRHTKMLRENDSLHVDVEEQRRLEDMVEQEAERERAETEQSIAEMCYLQGVLRERWDSWMVKSRAIKAFHSEPIVQNYPLNERTQNELEDLRRVQNMRKLDEAACTPSSAKNGSRSEDQKQEEEGRKEESAALTGSFSAQLGFSNPYIYDQFSLHTIEQKINQTVLLQDVIYSIKMAFNTEFEAQHRQKMQELRRVGARNKRIREIMQELDVNQELWESGLTDSEWPERLLTVDHSEIKAEKCLTPEQEEERKKMEETYLAAKFQGDESRENALDDMMDGVLEVQKLDILKMEIPVPEFVLTKPDNHWSEEEKNIYKEYEKKTKDLNEEKDKYKRSLEIEMKNLQKFSREGTEKFDEMLTKLTEKKVERTAAIYQEELKIIYFADSVLTEEEMRNSELELKLQLENLLAYKHEAREEVVRQEHEVTLFQEAYENVVAADKVLDGDFKKEFSDVPTQIVDQLYKLFKRRPRVQMMRAQTGKTSEFKEHRLHGSLVPDALSHVLRGMEELDSLKCMPESLDLSIWDRMCLLRRAKVESEQQVQMKALTLAEMQAFLKKREDDVNAAQQEITNCSEALKSLHKERNDHLINTRVQVVQRQGQLEMSSPDLSVGNTSTNFLCHKSIVDKLRGKSRSLEEKEICKMGKCKDALEQIVQLEWKQRVLQNKIEDLKEKKDIKMLRLSNQQQDTRCCSKKEQAQSIALMKKIHQQKVQQCQKRIEQIKQQEAKKTNSYESFEQQLPDLQVTVAELTSICGLAATEENLAAEREERYQEILQRKTWKETAISQADELLFLSEEVERLKKRNYISLDELEHHN